MITPKTLLLFFCLSMFHLFASSQESLSLAGKWYFKIDRKDAGITEKWYMLEFKDTVLLPGSMQNQGFGDNTSSLTNWLSTPTDNFFKNSKYNPYRKENNFKFPFWLTPVKYYQGAAWYQKTITIPQSWVGQNLILNLERCHWSTKVFFDNRFIGADSSLSTSHIYNLGILNIPGQHKITIRVDNRYIADIGPNAHSISDNTQGTWNGIIGNLTLKPVASSFITQVKIYPNISQNKARLEILLQNNSDKKQKGEIAVQAIALSNPQKYNHPKLFAEFSLRDTGRIYIDYPLTDSLLLWDEFAPNLYKMKVFLESKNEKYSDSAFFTFGMREIYTNEKQIIINGQRRFLRGTADCAIFPLTGYPSTDTAKWDTIFNTLKTYGLNHVRFHSWCPPEAAFAAADKLGIYLQIEIGSQIKLGSRASVDSFIFKESQRIVDQYGNHPSFCFMVPCHEPKEDNNTMTYTANFVNYWKNKDTRRLYAAGSGWPEIIDNDYNITPKPRINYTNDGVDYPINTKIYGSAFNYDSIVSTFSKPIISHETGQWSAYPNLSEINRYTGPLKPKNLEIFSDFLTQNQMEQQAKSFLMASGKLQAICYKADIEACLRTSDLSGFQLFSLTDYPGHGTSPVGLLNSFWESKPYITAKYFKQFCNSIVTLAEIPKFTWSNAETFKASIDVSNFYTNMPNAEISWLITAEDYRFIAKGKIKKALSIGLNKNIEEISINLASFNKPEQCILGISVNGEFYNSWNFWVYPVTDTYPFSKSIIITDTLTTPITSKLMNGGKVLLLLNNKIKQGKGKEIKTGFSPILRNTEYTENKGIQTLGILCDPSHHIFKEFPTQFHSNWQWWDIINLSQPMILNDFPLNLTPTIQIIDDWFQARKLGILFEAKVGKGKIIVTSIDFKTNINNRVAAYQLYKSILNYMSSANFTPLSSIELGLIKGLYE